MTSYERIKRTYERKETDRVPIIDKPWAGTIKRWEREGMPKGMDWRDYFGVDKLETIGIDITPRYPVKIIEETDKYVISTTAWGATQKRLKDMDATAEVLDFKVVDAEAWADAKAKMTLEDDRIPWKRLEENYAKWRAEGRWISACFWFGFDVAHSRMMGTDTMLITLLDEPELAQDIFDTYLRCSEVLFERIWNAGYHFDEVYWPDDMGYKGTAFFSSDTYKEVLQPYHTRAVKWAHDHGIPARLHSCGDITWLLPDIIDTGIDALNPLEVKSGLDAFEVKKKFGDKIVLHGGMNAQLWSDTDAAVAEIREKLPCLMENGRYFFASDHTIPNNVSLETMKRIVEEAKRLGSYN